MDRFLAKQHISKYHALVEDVTRKHGGKVIQCISGTMMLAFTGTGGNAMVAGATMIRGNNNCITPMRIAIHLLVNQDNVCDTITEALKSGEQSHIYITTVTLMHGNNKDVLEFIDKKFPGTRSRVKVYPTNCIHNVPEMGGLPLSQSGCGKTGNEKIEVAETKRQRRRPVEASLEG